MAISPWPLHRGTAHCGKIPHGIFVNGNNIQETVTDNFYCIALSMVSYLMTSWPWQDARGKMAAEGFPRPLSWSSTIPETTVYE